MFNKWTSIVGASCVAGLITLSGCAVTMEDEPESLVGRSTPQQQSAPMRHHNDGMNRVHMAYPTGDQATSVIGIEKSFPSEVRINSPFTYEMTVTNFTDHPLHDVVVTDELSDNVKLRNLSGDNRVDENGLTWPVGLLGPNESKAVALSAVATASGNINSCASVAYNPTLCASIPVVEPSLAIMKSGPAEALLCDEITYRFDVTNTGTGVVDDVRILETLPPGLQTMDSGTSIIFDVGRLAPNETRQYTATLKASKPGAFAGKATASGEGDIFAASNEVRTVIREPILKITQTGPKMKFIGRDSTYEMMVMNEGDGLARETVIEQTLPQGAKLINASEGARVNGGRIHWPIGALVPGKSATVFATISYDKAGVIATTASARAHCASPVSASAQTQYKGIPAILMEVIDLKDPVEIGETQTYVITATNQGSAIGTHIKIECELEDNFEYVSSSGMTQGVVEGGKVTFAPLASLAPGRKAQWMVVAKAIDTGDVRVKVSMTSDQLGRPVEETEASNVYR